MTEDDGSTRQRRPWPWLLAIVAALLVGGGIGVAGTYHSANADVEAARTQIGQLRTELGAAEGQLAWYQSRQQAMSDRKAALDAREKLLDGQADDLDAREQEVKAAEVEIAQNTIPGSGVLLVGEDIDPGTYFTEGTSDGCYWARLEGTTGSDIIANGFAEGPTTVTILSSDAAFETSGCPDWTLR